MLGEEILWLERQSTRATLGRKDMYIYWLEMSLTLGMEELWLKRQSTKATLGMKTRSLTLGMEELWLESQSTRATLVRQYIRISWRELVYEMISG
jgi:hypothetical protein